jgi:hypothetical protein
LVLPLAAGLFPPRPAGRGIQRRFFVIWNKTKKRNPWGIQQQRKRPEKDWIQIPMRSFELSQKANGRPPTIV